MTINEITATSLIAEIDEALRGGNAPRQQELSEQLTRNGWEIQIRRGASGARNGLVKRKEAS
jgi:hypothetical protein